MRLTSPSTYLGCALFLLAGTVWAQNGAQLYNAHCAACHSSGAAHMPPESALRAMSAAQILATLQTGVMKTIAAGLADGERQAVASYLGTKPSAVGITPSATCRTQSPLDARAPSWAGWSPDGANARFQNAAAAGITAAQVPNLKLEWAFSLGEVTEARSQPAVFGGRIFFGTGSGAVYALDARSGCIEWMTKVATGVRSAVTVGESGDGYDVFFGAGPSVYALDAATGKLRWTTRVAAHAAAIVTAAPLVHDGVVYVGVSSYEELLAALPAYSCCSFRGSVVALDAHTGRKLWKTYTIAAAPRPTVKNAAGVMMFGPSGAGVWSTPTWDQARGLVEVATGDNYSLPASEHSDSVLALGAKTGKLAWARQLRSGDAFNEACLTPGNTTCPQPAGPDADFGQPPILVALPHGHRALVIGQKSGVAYALDPDRQGALLWRTKVAAGGALGGTEWGSASDASNLYVAISDVGFKVLPGPKLVLDPDHGGGLVALRLASGQTAWRAAPPIHDCGGRSGCSPAQSQAVSAIAGVVFSGSIDGHLRAYSADTGRILWDFNTAQTFKTVNGVAAHGGSLDGPGPAVAGGMLYVSSGYGKWGGIPGNVLLAFSVDGN